MTSIFDFKKKIAQKLAQFLENKRPIYLRLNRIIAQELVLISAVRAESLSFL